MRTTRQVLGTAAGSVSLNAEGVVYRGRRGFSGPDSIEIVVADPRGFTSRTTITVLVQPDEVPGGVLNLKPTVTMGVNGELTISFLTLPATNFVVERSSDMEGWEPFVEEMSDEDGRLTITDALPPQPQAYYRLVWPNP